MSPEERNIAMSLSISRKINELYSKYDKYSQNIKKLEKKNIHLKIINVILLNNYLLISFLILVIMLLLNKLI